MQIIDVLGDEEKLARPFRVEPRQGLVRRVRLNRAEPRAPRVIESMNQRGIAAKCIGRGDILDAMAFPQAVRSAESRKPAFRRYAGAGQNHDMVNSRGTHRAGLEPDRAELKAPSQD